MAGFLNQQGMSRFRYTMNQAVSQVRYIWERQAPAMGVGGRKQGRKWPERSKGQRGGGGGKRPEKEGTEEGQNGNRKGGYERPPPWLRGRAIGLWHRDRNRALGRGGKKEKPKEFIPIELDPDREMEINQLLLSTKVKPPSSVSNRLENDRLRQAEQSQVMKNNKYWNTKQIQQKIKKEDMEVDAYHWMAVGSSGQSVKREWNETADNWHDVKFKRKPIKIEPEESQNESREPDLWGDVKPDISQLNIKVEDFADGSKKAAQNRYSHLEESAFKRKFLQSITGSIEENLQRSLSGKSSLIRDTELDTKLKESLVQKVNSRHYKDMMQFRKKLPVFDKKSDVLDLIDKNQIIVLSGETGCGKTTQVAQFILDAEIEKGQGSMCHIVCTQPRRISAISVAERVADERNDTCGGVNSSVGFQIRLESKIPRPRGSIVFCTTGILLQYMYTDPALRQISHLILDEIHERDTISDFVIAILKDVIPKRPDLKLVLMSATLNAEHFSNYYGDCPSINVPGFTFPVTEYYLEDVLQMTGFQFPSRSKAREKYIRYLQRNGSEANATFEGFIKPYVRQLRSEKRYSQNVLESLENPDSEEINLELILELIGYICHTQNDGAILVFLPGWDKIVALNRLMNESGSFPTYRYLIIPLHSMLSTATQRTVFNRPAPGVRKIVIATNIAETSITIDDVVYVIDCGKIKMKNFDVEKNIQTLQPEWVSLANARQRRGRAGRVQAGVCYHMFSRAREMVLAEYQLPEMLRTRLEEVILQAKTLQLGRIKPFLEKVMDPPDPRAVEISLKLLETLAALDEDENLTPLGYHLGQLPLDPQTGKMILMAAIFSCVDPIFSVAASLSFKDAFVIPLNQEDNANQKKDELSLGLKSDHLVLAEAMRRWEQAEGRGYGRSFAKEYFLSPSTLALLSDMKTQFADHLYRMKFLNSSNPKARDANLNSQNMALVKAVICAGLYPNIAIVKSVRRMGNGRVLSKLCTPEDGPVSIHPKSINERQAQFESRFLIYHLKIKSKQINLHDTTMVYALPLLFFGKVFSIQKHENKVILPINDEIIFTCSERTAKLIKELRTRLDWLLEHKVSHPGITDWESNCEETTLLKAIMKLITYEDQQMMMIAQEGDDFSE